MSDSNSPLNVMDLLNPQEIQSVANTRMYNILTASASIALFSWYSNDPQNDLLKKAGTMAASQLFGATLVDILQRGGKLNRDSNPMMANGDEALRAGAFYSVVAIQGFKFPNVNNKQFQEAVLGSVIGTTTGASVRSMLN